jgi:hypothetical protein
MLTDFALHCVRTLEWFSSALIERVLG